MKASQKNTGRLYSRHPLIKAQSLSIFNKVIKNNSKLIPFNVKMDYAGETKYFPPFSKEWKNSIYVFNFNNLKNLPLYNMNINTLVRHYFNLYFNHKFINNKLASTKIKRLSLNKIFVSKAEIKHTNSKATITIYTYNREKKILLKKIKMIKNLFYKKILSLLYNSGKLCKLNGKNISGSSVITTASQSKLLHLKTIINLLRKELILFRRLKLKLSLNKYKFEEKFLYKLSKLISNFYNKKVEFNIINMKSIILNSDFFTEILSLKLKNRNTNIMRLLNIILNKVRFPEVNKVIEKSIAIKSVNMDLIDNKYKNLNLNSIITASGVDGADNYKLDNVFNNLYINLMRVRNTSILLPLAKKNSLKNMDAPGWKKSVKIGYGNVSGKLSEIIFNEIKYKNMGGIRLEIKGRLTKRYRADRALFKVKWKGGLKNIDSSYKGLSSVNLRGFIKPNVEYSIFTSKRRIGAFAVKGWISGK